MKLALLLLSLCSCASAIPAHRAVFVDDSARAGAWVCAQSPDNSAEVLCMSVEHFKERYGSQIRGQTSEL